MKIEVMLADGHPVVRCGLRRMIEGTHDLVVGAETGNGQAALELLRSRPWGLAVLDLWIPGRSGLELIKLIKCELPRLPILWRSGEEAFVQADLDGMPKRAALWGADAGHTATALTRFVEGGALDEMLSRVWVGKGEWQA